MEFWGVEIKPGQSLAVPPEEGKLLHLSQVSLGQPKKESSNDSVIVSLKVDGKTLVLGTLSAGKIPQISFDLVFEKQFELSHNWKNGSIYFVGYLAPDSVDEDEDINDFYPDSSEEDEPLQVPVENTANGKPEPKAEKSKGAVTNKAAPKAKPEAKNDDDSDEDDSSDDSDDDDISLPVESGDSEEDDSDDMSDDDSDEDEMEEDEDTPKKKPETENKKKRPTESATKTPVPAKKVKVAASPEKTDAKKGNVHSATPHPKKAVAKTPAANSEKGKAPATPKSGGSIGCNSCSKKFNTDKALESHTKAKHEAK